MKYLFFLILFFQIQTLKSQNTYKNYYLVLVTSINSYTSKPTDAYRSHYALGYPYKTKEECTKELDDLLVSESQRNKEGQAYGRKDKSGYVEIIYGNGGINIFSCSLITVKD